MDSSNVSWIWLPSFRLPTCLMFETQLIVWLCIFVCYKRETVTRRRSKENEPDSFSLFFIFLFDKHQVCCAGVRDGWREAELDSSRRRCKGCSHALHALMHLRMRGLLTYLPVISVANWQSAVAPNNTGTANNNTGRRFSLLVRREERELASIGYTSSQKQKEEGARDLSGGLQP